MRNRQDQERYPLHDICSRSDIQFETDSLVTGKQCTGTWDIVLVNMYISQVEGDRLQGKFYLPCHQVQMINVSRQSEICITAALVCGQHQFSIVNLKLHQAQAGRLVAFHTGLTQEKHIILTVTFLPVDFVYEWRQLLK